MHWPPRAESALEVEGVEPMKSLMIIILSGALTATFPVRAAESDRDEAARNYFSDRLVVDQNGNKLRFYSDVLSDRVVLINVLYTNCDSGCPLTTQLLIGARGKLVDAIKENVWFVSVSTDPERDTPEALKAFADQQGVDESRWLFLTGPKENIDHILKKLRRYSPSLETHSTQMLVGTTRERHEWIPLPGGVQADAIAAVLRSLAEERPG
jgi:cytochrome oxidase Cu insertion factor (SCO1/SenC/PrrC family)